jgi:hypothetical protein
MKKVLVLLTAVTVIIACNDNANVASTNSTSDDTNHAKYTESTKEVYRAIETGDVSRLDSFIAEDVVDHNANPDGSDIKGRDSVKKPMAAISKAVTV